MSSSSSSSSSSSNNSNNLPSSRKNEDRSASIRLSSSRRTSSSVRKRRVTTIDEDYYNSCDNDYTAADAADADGDDDDDNNSNSDRNSGVILKEEEEEENQQHTLFLNRIARNMKRVGDDNDDEKEKKEEKPPQNENQKLDNNNKSIHKNDNHSQPKIIQIPRRWIYDRVDGKVHLRNKEKKTVPKSRSWEQRGPPCFLCYPSPLVKIFPWLLEENYLCTTIGKCGFDDDYNSSCRGSGSTTRYRQQSTYSDKDQNDNNNNGNNNNTNIRSSLLQLGLFANTGGLLATILACFALSKSNMDLMEGVSFAKASLIPSSSSSSFDNVTLYMGLRALGIDNPNTGSSSDAINIISFDNFCTTVGMEQFLPLEECDVCAHTNVYIILALLVTMAAYVPTFISCLLRLYNQYDMNFCKTSSGFWSLVSLIGYLSIFYCYNYRCLSSLYEGPVIYNYTTGNVVVIDNDDLYDNDNNNNNNASVLVDFQWSMGTGQILFMVGFFLKIIDLISNCCIATPTITRSREEQWDYENVVFDYEEKNKIDNTGRDETIIDNNADEDNLYGYVVHDHHHDYSN